MPPPRASAPAWARAIALGAAAALALLLRSPVAPCVDLCSYRAAGALAAAGRSAAAYDGAALAAAHRADHVTDRRVGGFLYSPLWLGPAALVAALPQERAAGLHRGALAALLAAALALVLVRLARPAEQLALAAAVALGHPAWMALVVQNWSVLLLAGLAAAWLAGGRGRLALAGVAWAAAIHLKAFLALAALPLAATRRRRELAWALGAGALLALVSLAWVDLGAWSGFSRLLGAASERGVTPYYNKVSLAAGLARFAVDPRAWLAPREPVAVVLVRTLALLGLAALVAGTLRLRRDPERLLAFSTAWLLLFVPQVWDHTELLLVAALPALPRRLFWTLTAWLAGTFLYHGAVERLLARTLAGETPPLALAALLMLFPAANLLALAGALAPPDPAPAPATAADA